MVHGSVACCLLCDVCDHAVVYISDCRLIMSINNEDRLISARFAQSRPEVAPPGVCRNDFKKAGFVGVIIHRSRALSATESSSSIEGTGGRLGLVWQVTGKSVSGVRAGLVGAAALDKAAPPGYYRYVILYGAPDVSHSDGLGLPVGCWGSFPGTGPGGAVTADGPIPLNGAQPIRIPRRSASASTELPAA